MLASSASAAKPATAAMTAISASATGPRRGDGSTGGALATGPVPHAAVAVRAAQLVAPLAAAEEDVVNEVAVAAQAARLQDGRVARLDEDRLVEVLQREPLRVVVAV